MIINTINGAYEAMGITGRVVISQQKIICPITTGVTLASLCTGGVLPVDAVSCEIIADGGAIRIGLKFEQLATLLVGIPLADQTSRIIDSSLLGVSVISAGAAPVNAQVVFFDRV